MRVIYRGDLDGTVCAAILKSVGLCDELKQAHPRDMQEGKIEVSQEDIICNLPYHADCHMWFDHHSGEIDKTELPSDFRGLVEEAPSAAGLVYKYFLPDHPELKRFEKTVHDTDLFDSADLTAEQVKDPEGAILLGFLLDPRTGLGLTHDFSISNYQWVLQVPELLTEHSVDEVLAMADAKERVEKYREMQDEAAQFYLENSHLDGNVIVTDVRGKEVPPANRFLIYTLPGLEKGNISVRVAHGKKGEFDTISVAHSIFDRSSTVDANALCRKYGGGGLKAAATCQPTLDQSEKVLEDIVKACRE